MRKIVIATHGDFADGALSAIHMIAGDKQDITCFNVYTKHKNLQEAIDAYFMNCKEEDELIIFTDLFGGSVNQGWMPYSKQANVFVIAGFNLALLLEVVMLERTVRVDMEQLRKIIARSKEQIILVQDLIDNQYKDDFD